MKNSFQAVLISLDGLDHVTDFRKSKTIKEVWDNINDMGSKWYFYPIPFVVNESTGKIRGVPDNLDFLMNITINDAKRFIVENNEDVLQLCGIE